MSMLKGNILKYWCKNHLLPYSHLRKRHSLTGQKAKGLWLTNGWSFILKFYLFKLWNDTNSAEPGSLGPSRVKAHRGSFIPGPLGLWPHPMDISSVSEYQVAKDILNIQQNSLCWNSAAFPSQRKPLYISSKNNILFVFFVLMDSHLLIMFTSVALVNKCITGNS
jgi:hypothetical protein